VPLVEDARTRLRRGGRLLVKEAGAFGVVGAACFVLDLLLFQLLYAGAGTGAVTARLISALVSMTAAFVGHRYWSFAHRARTGIGREYGLFFLVNGATMCLGLAAVAVAVHGFAVEGVLALQAVNVGSIAVGTLIRFVAYRRWVFVAEGAPVAVARHERGGRVRPRPVSGRAGRRAEAAARSAVEA
jgi:putative flippase GtrA